MISLANENSVYPWKRAGAPSDSERPSACSKVGSVSIATTSVKRRAGQAEGNPGGGGDMEGNPRAGRGGHGAQGESLSFCLAAEPV